MEPVHILGRVDGIDNQITVQMRGQGQLHQNAMHRGVIVQPLHQRQKIAFRCFGGQAVFKAVHANFNGRCVFVFHINAGGWIIAHQNHCKARGKGVAFFHCRHMGGHLGAHAGGKGFAVDDLGCHFTGLS